MHRILLGLTSGDIKSQTGLDNIDVIKGHENFENIQLMVDELTAICGGENAKTTGENLKKKIDASQEFHKVNFIRHLEHSK